MGTWRGFVVLLAAIVALAGCRSAPSEEPARPSAVVATPAPALIDGGAAGTSAGNVGTLGTPGSPPPVPANPQPPAPPTTPNLPVNDAFFVSHLQAAGAPGAAMAIVKHGAVVWQKGYGYADLATQRAATPDTLFMLASISKTFVATALLQLAEHSQAGLAVLDQDVNVGSNLPFVVRNPYFPDEPITYRMLLTHTSSLIDGPYFENFSATPGDSSIPLGNFLASYLQDARNWSNSDSPGYEYSYSNAGITLVGYIVERVTGMNLQQYSGQYLFAPLGMNESSWFLTGLDPSHVAMPYVLGGGGYQATGQYGFPDYPDGQLRTSAAQLARWLVMLAGDGSLGGARILAPSTIAEMRRAQFGPNGDYQGLVLFGGSANGIPTIGHNGATLGGSTDMWFDPVSTMGYVLLTNGNAYLDGTDAQKDAMSQMNDELGRLAASVP